MMEEIKEQEAEVQTLCIRQTYTKQAYQSALAVLKKAKFNPTVIGMAVLYLGIFGLGSACLGIYYNSTFHLVLCVAWFLMFFMQYPGVGKDFRKSYGEDALALEQEQTVRIEQDCITAEILREETAEAGITLPFSKVRLYEGDTCFVFFCHETECIILQKSLLSEQEIAGVQSITDQLKGYRRVQGDSAEPDGEADSFTTDDSDGSAKPETELVTEPQPEAEPAEEAQDHGES